MLTFLGASVASKGVLYMIHDGGPPMTGQPARVLGVLILLVALYSSYLGWRGNPQGDSESSKDGENVTDDKPDR